MEHASDPLRHLAEARASLLANVGELGRRFQEVRAKLDVRAHIAAHPLLATGAALTAGALLALARASPRREREEAGLGAAALAALAALGLRLAKEIALREASAATRRWWERERASPDAPGGYDFDDAPPR